jgi:hypothetical protein
MIPPGSKPRSSSSSSSSSSDREGGQKQGLEQKVMNTLTGNQSSSLPGQNTGYVDPLMANQGITDQGYQQPPMQYQQGGFPSTKEMAKQEAKVTLIQKVKDKVLHHNKKP